MTASLVHQPDGTTRLYANYDTTFIELLKRDIPSMLRRWDPTDKAWILRGSAIATARKLAEQCYGHVSETAAQPPGRAVTSPHATLHLMPDAPPGLVDTAYRWLAKENHPDRGGDTREMQRINEAYDALREKRRVA